MADGIAPAIDKVGEPAPAAPEAQAKAPTMPTSAPATDGPKPGEKIPDGAGPAVANPKPVQIVSVPQTPLNNQTPAGGTPRPELRIEEEPKEPPQPEEAVVITGIMEPQPTPVTSTPKDDDLIKDIKEVKDKVVSALTNGANKVVEMTGALQSSDDNDAKSAKRKLEEPSDDNAKVNGEPDSSSRNDKKARVEDETPEESAAAAAPAAAPISAPATNGKSNNNNGKAKKDKKAAPVVGRTARKTRSQGPAEA